MPEAGPLETGAPPPVLLVQSVGDSLSLASPSSPGGALPEPPMLVDRRKRQASAPGMPPPLRRQNASRFEWPPDRNQEWTYIRFSPAEFCEQAAFSLGLQLSVQQVCDLFEAEAPIKKSVMPWRSSQAATLLWR